MNKTLSWLILLALVFGTCAALIIAGESHLRANWRGRVSMYMPDKAAIARYKPGIFTIRTVNGKPVILRTNRHGIRHDGDIDPRDADVLILGDSNVAGLYLPFNLTLGQQLEQKLHSVARVADLAVSGYGPDQSARRYISIAGESKAGAVVFHIFADNDLGDLFRNNIYRQDDSGTWITRSDLARDPLLTWDRYKLVQRLWGLLELHEESFYKLAGGPTYYNALHTYLGGTARSSTYPDALKRYTEISKHEYQNYLAGKHTIWLADHYDYGIAVDPDGRMAQHAVKILAHVLSQAASAFRGRRECFFVMVQPAEDDLKEWGGTSVSRFQLRQFSDKYYPRGLTDLVIKAADAAGIDYIDLYPVFAGSPNDYYYSERQKPMDNHWNERAIEVAAELLAERIEHDNCIDKIR